MLRILSDSILSVLYPQECRVCGDEVGSSDDGVACTTCWNETRIFSDNETLCDKCGAFLFAGRSSKPAVCRKCEDHSYDHAFSIGLYEKGLAASVLELKKVPHFPATGKRLLVDLLDRSVPGNTDVVIPVPLSARRLRERGFNQAAIIGKDVAKHLGVELDESTLIRKVHTPMHRAGMDKKARAITVRNAFEVARPNLIEGKTVLLVDDIFTSGETASSCAKVLKKSGAATVNVLTIARAA
ncbi:MAG TPA: double zinc ribbon domain-containing protein [Pyrinomonadaceae bacterium]|nr:double zinc ribbon domain-containing protein [Pyrinomonadaceae bacterium]